jgi:hypothetical protein
MNTCPTCGHAHPDGLGLALCLCSDCGLLFGGVPRRFLAPKYAARLIELEAKKAKA